MPYDESYWPTCYNYSARSQESWDFLICESLRGWPAGHIVLPMIGYLFFGNFPIAWLIPGLFEAFEIATLLIFGQFVIFESNGIDRETLAGSLIGDWIINGTMGVILGWQIARLTGLPALLPWNLQYHRPATPAGSNTYSDDQRRQGSAIATETDDLASVGADDIRKRTLPIHPGQSLKFDPSGLRLDFSHEDVAKTSSHIGYADSGGYPYREDDDGPEIHSFSDKTRYIVTQEASRRDHAVLWWLKWRQYLVWAGFAFTSLAIALVLPAGCASDFAPDPPPCKNIGVMVSAGGDILWLGIALLVIMQTKSDYRFIWQDFAFYKQVQVVALVAVVDLTIKIQDFQPYVPLYLGATGGYTQPWLAAGIWIVIFAIILLYNDGWALFRLRWRLRKRIMRANCMDAREICRRSRRPSSV